MKLIKKIKELARLDLYFNKTNRNTYDTLASLLLHRLFPDSTILPFTPFSLNPNTILHIINEIQINKRNSIIEFGSGISTLIIAKYLKENNIKASFISIEDNKEWAQYINDLLKKYDCENQANVVYAPLKEYISTKYDGLWYDVDIFLNVIKDLQFDLVMVDGPGAGNNKLTRLPAVFEISDFLLSDFIIFLDDTKRKGEKKIFYKWKQYLNEIGINASGEINDSKVYATINSGQRFSSNPMNY